MVINKPHIIFGFLFVMIAMLFLSSCIYEDDSICVQFDVTPKFVDTDGTILSDSSLNLNVYLFLNNKFSNIVTASNDGTFPISFYNKSTASLVMMAYSDSDNVSTNESTSKRQTLRSISEDSSDISITKPKVGDNITDCAVTISSTSSVDNFYYGRLDYDPDSLSGNVWQQVETLYNMRANVHVVVEELHEVYGSGGDYSVELSGLHSSLTFAGKTSGDSITAIPDAEFLDDGDLMSDKVSTWPTKDGEYITLSIYRDGILIWKSSVDKSGDPVTLSAGDDKVFLVDCTQIGFTITVLSWKAYSQNVAFY